MDRYKLEYEIKSKGYTIEGFARKVGISKAAFYRKCRGKSQFTLEEIQKIVDCLKLKSPMGIFFKDEVS